MKSILNIKLKKHTKPYVWLEGATRHDIPTNNGFGVGYFEIGNHEVSLYGRIAYNYTYHDDINTDVNRTNTGYNQKYTQYSRNDANKWIGELLLKYQITEKDYFAVHVYDSNNITDEKSDANGYYFSNIQQIYSFNSFSKNKSNIFTSSMYYKHSFSKDNDLGYKSIHDTLDITESCRHIFELEEEVNELNEVTVEFDRSKIVKRTANGQGCWTAACQSGTRR